MPVPDRFGPDIVVRLTHGAPTPAGPGVFDVPAFPSDGGGAAPLIDLLSRLDRDAVVVLVHDDAELGVGSMERLAGVVRGGRAPVAVPLSNDLGTDHGLDGPALGDGQLRPARLVRPTCMAATAATMRDLAERRLHDPLTLLADVDIGLVAVGGTSLRHTNRCVDRVRALGSGPTPPIVATLIVRDEERMLGDCLASITGFVDRVHVADTGSVDRTVEIATAAGAEVIHRTWRDDFAWARNEVLAEARDAAWALWIDADERLVCDDPMLLRGYLRAFAAEHDVLELPVRNLRADGSETTRFAGPRLLRASEITFWGALHEHPILIDRSRALRKSMIGLAMLDHLGYSDELLNDGAKQERNVAVARAAYQRDPAPKTALDLARSLSFAQREPAEAARLYREGLAGIPDHDHRARAFVTAQLAGHFQDRLGDQLAALAEAERGLALVPADWSCRAVLARALRALGRSSELPARAVELDARASLIPMSSALDAQMMWHLLLGAALGQTTLPGPAWDQAALAAGLGAPLTPGDVAVYLEVALARPVPELVRACDAVCAVADPVSRDAVLRTIAVRSTPPFTVELSRAVLERVPTAEAVLLGVLVSERTGRPTDAAWFSARAAVLGAEVADRLAARLDERGSAQLAVTVRAAVASAGAVPG